MNDSSDSHFQRAIWLVESASKELTKAAAVEGVRQTSHCGRLLDFAGGLHVFSRRLERIRAIAPELTAAEKNGK